MEHIRGRVGETVPVRTMRSPSHPPWITSKDQRRGGGSGRVRPDGVVPRWLCMGSYGARESSHDIILYRERPARCLVAGRASRTASAAAYLQSDARLIASADRRPHWCRACWMRGPLTVFEL